MATPPISAPPSARLRKLHRAGFTHNDLAKEQNWLRGLDGRAYLTDFQLAACFRRGRLFRIAAYEDLRHLLKHKRNYVPDALTATERSPRAQELVASIWMATGKRVYIAITRGLFSFTDREGGGPRLVNDAPVLVARSGRATDVRDAAIVAFPDRRVGTGLYAFVEGNGPSEQAIRDLSIKTSTAARRRSAGASGGRALPRGADGSVRTEILQLIAMNQLDQVDPLIKTEVDRAFLKDILESRKNLRDRFNFDINGYGSSVELTFAVVTRREGG